MNNDKSNASDFRDSVSTIGKKGKRIWIYPNKPAGRYYRARTLVSVILLAFFFAALFLKIDGRPILLFDIINRQFNIFGLSFWPQDFHILVLAAIALIVFILLFTAILGRLFCGWVCPQTIFMEMLFRKIEYFIEGNAWKQKKLDNSNWTFEKTAKKGLKHFIFFGISFVIGNTFLAYIIGIDRLMAIITDPPSEHLAGLAIMLLFSLVFYGVFARFREQVCILVCPYGRLQSVLIDSNSVIVGYDYNRGEPRNRLKDDKKRERSGHCIDCFSCVRVCTTGIDIRNGVQLECIHCTACMDACDSVMRSVKLPTGLIRYTSQDTLEGKKAFRLTPRMGGYGSLFAVLLSIVVFLIAARSDIETTILRTPGVLYEVTDDGAVRNLYNISVVNKTFEDLKLRLRLKDLPGEIQYVGSDLSVPAGGKAEGVFFMVIQRSNLYSENSLVELEVLADGRVMQKLTTSFSGPKPAGRD
jgi:cytochrome c oxidase accessory protein FixG